MKKVIKENTDTQGWLIVKIEKKLVNSATNKVMDIAFECNDSEYRIKFYRRVAWDLLLLAAAMEYENCLPHGL